MKTEAVLIFDIGKTNKKIMLFSRELKVIHEEEVVFQEISDDDGFPCDDIDRLESWILEACAKYLHDERFLLRGINFTTYGATLMYVDGRGESFTPVYNYLKPMPAGIAEPIYEAFGGKSEFCRKTASPELGMLNSGFQALWLMKVKPQVYRRVENILHFPQYLSFLLTGKISSEHTSIGCHTGLWDFDQMQYHPWTKQLGDKLPQPEPAETTYPSALFDSKVPVGIGIHDSSSSLVPYFKKSKEEFILISTGTWCISMNPFNEEPLTEDQLKKDCLSFLSIRQKPVKSSRFFMGRIHDENVKRLTDLFGENDSAYKYVGLDVKKIRALLAKCSGARVFFQTGVPENYIDLSIKKETFDSFADAYHQLLMDLANLVKESIDLIISSNDHSRDMYISGGFSKNLIFLTLIASYYPGKRVYASEVSNATSLGAALILWRGIDSNINPELELNLNLINGDPSLVN